MAADVTRPDIPDGLPEPAREAAYRAYRCWRIGDDGDGRLHAALVAAAPLIRAAERERAEKAEAKLAALAAEARAVMGGYPLLPFVRAEKILAITGTGEAEDNG